MLIKRPAEFARVAHEWAVRFAGAPQRELGEGSGASSSNASTTAAAKSKEMEEAEEAERIARYNHVQWGDGHIQLTDVATAAIMRP